MRRLRSIARSSRPRRRASSDPRRGIRSTDLIAARTPAPDGVTCEPETIAGVGGWWCRPANPQPGRVLLYLHGGGFVIGSAGAYRNLVGQIAARANVAAFATDYRLAPEHPFPVVSPWVDLALEGESMETRASADPLFSRTGLAKGARLYLGDRDRKDPAASPLYGDVANLAPIQIHVGEDEVLLDDSVRYAARVAEAGGIADLHVWEGMLHVFPSSVSVLEAARVSLDEKGIFLRSHLG